MSDFWWVMGAWKDLHELMRRERKTDDAWSTKMGIEVLVSQASPNFVSGCPGSESGEGGVRWRMQNVLSILVVGGRRGFPQSCTLYHGRLMTMSSDCRDILTSEHTMCSWPFGAVWPCHLFLIDLIMTSFFPTLEFAADKEAFRIVVRDIVTRTPSMMLSGLAKKGGDDRGPEDCSP